MIITHDVLYPQVINDEEDDTIVMATSLVRNGPILTATTNNNTSDSSGYDRTSGADNNYHFKCNPAIHYLFTTPSEEDSDGHSRHHFDSNFNMPPERMNDTSLRPLEYLPEAYILLYLHDITQVCVTHEYCIILHCSMIVDLTCSSCRLYRVCNICTATTSLTETSNRQTYSSLRTTH